MRPAKAVQWRAGACWLFLLVLLRRAIRAAGGAQDSARHSCLALTVAAPDSGQ